MIDTWDIDNMSDHREHIGLSILKNYSKISICWLVKYFPRCSALFSTHLNECIFFLSPGTYPENGEGNFENGNFSLERKQLDPLATKCYVCEVWQQYLYWAANKHFGSFYYNKHVQILTKQSFIAKDDTTYEYSQIRRHLIRDLLKWKKRHHGLSNLNNLDEHNWKGPLWGSFLLSGAGAHVWLFFTAPLVCLLNNVMSKNGGGCDRSVFNTRLGFLCEHKFSEAKRWIICTLSSMVVTTP